MTLSRWATLALLAVRATAVSPQDVAAGIRSLTDLSSRANDIAKGLSIDNLDENVPVRAAQSARDVAVNAIDQLTRVQSARKSRTT